MISIFDRIKPINQESIDITFRSEKSWWMASSLSMNTWPAEMLGSCITEDGFLYGGHTASAINISQRPALY